MFKILSIAFAFLATTVQAGNLVTTGLDDPHVTPPARVTTDWSGPYVGLSYGQTTSTTTTTVHEYDTIECGPTNCDVDVPEHLIGNAELNALPEKVYGLPKGDPNRNCGLMTYDCSTHWDNAGNATELWLTEAITVQTAEYDVSTVTDVESFGVHAGYRWNTGVAVTGAELSTDGSLTTLEGSVGLPLGEMLPYGFVGVGQFEGSGGFVAGVGGEWMIANGFSIGAKQTFGEFGDTSTATTGLRVSFNF